MMTSELTALAVMGLFMLFAWLPSSLAKYQQYGAKWLASNRPQPAQELTGAGGRAAKAHENLKENLPAFIIAIIVVEFSLSHSAWTERFAWAFVIARIIHFFVYTWGFVPLRALSWLVGVVSTLGLFLSALLSFS